MTQQWESVGIWQVWFVIIQKGYISASGQLCDFYEQGWPAYQALNIAMIPLELQILYLFECVTSTLYGRSLVQDEGNISPHTLPLGDKL